MTAVGVFGGLARTNTKQLVSTMTFLICTMRYRIQGFSLISPTQMSPSGDCGFRRFRTLLCDRKNVFYEDRAVPTVVNPTSKRRIHLGGPKYTELMNEGGWVQHEGTLQRIDMEMLGRFQHDSSFQDEITIPPFEEYCNTEDEWYPVAPVVLRRIDESPKAEDSTNAPTSIPIDERMREKLQQELLFVYKPSHLHSVPSRSLSDSLATQVQSLYPGSKPCHRLDRDTSGIVLFGLTKESHRDASMQFEARTTSKTYVALVAGRPGEDHGIVNLPIGKKKTKEGFVRWAIGGEKQRESITHWRVDRVFTDEETGAVFTKMILKPVTGRGHQLRLHMKAIGCPIIGDTIHGESAVAVCSPRLCLHAKTLQIDWDGFRLEADSLPPF